MPVTVLLAAVGAALLTVTAWDVVGSLLGDDGRGGLVSGRAGRSVWAALERRRRTGRHRSSHVIGRLIVLGVPLSWMATVWLGWVAIFCSVEGNVVASADRTAAGVVEKIYFVGYVLFTLGNGEYQPAGSTWRIMAVLATLSGFVILTLGVTFIVPVVQAATTRRRTASYISLSGTTVSELADAIAMKHLDPIAAARQITELTEEHRAFPVLHFLHTREARHSAPTMNARLALASGADVHPSLSRALNEYLAVHPMIPEHRGDVWPAVLAADGRAPTDSEAAGG